MDKQPSPRCHSAKHHGWTLIRHPDGSATWTSPLHRRYQRPAPWNPPRVDLHADLPPIRPRTTAPPPDNHDEPDTPLLDALTTHQPEQQPAEPAEEDDAPPF